MSGRFSGQTSRTAANGLDQRSGCGSRSCRHSRRSVVRVSARRSSARGSRVRSAAPATGTRRRGRGRGGHEVGLDALDSSIVISRGTRGRPPPWARADGAMISQPRGSPPRDVVVAFPRAVGAGLAAGVARAGCPGRRRRPRSAHGHGANSCGLLVVPDAERQPGVMRPSGETASPRRHQARPAARRPARCEECQSWITPSCGRVLAHGRNRDAVPQGDVLRA